MRYLAGTLFLMLSGLALGEGDLRYEGVVRSIDAPKKLIEVDVSTLIQPDGSTVSYGSPKKLKFSWTPKTRVAGQDVKARAVDTTDFSVGQVVTLVTGSQEEPLPLRLVILPKRDRTQTVASRGTPRFSRQANSKHVKEGDGVCREVITVPMIFPILGRVDLTDTFLAPRGKDRRHLGQDLMAPKMRPLVAAFDGIVYPKSTKDHNWLRLVGDNGWTAYYMHINIDTPGTLDMKGTDKFAFAPGIEAGARVVAGQLIAYCGDSGNARNVASHLHFELHDADDAIFNAFPSLTEATRLDKPVPPAFPEFDEQPKAKQARFDGTVLSIDKTSKKFTLNVAAIQSGTNERKSVSEPTFEQLDLVNPDLAVGSKISVIKNEGSPKPETLYVYDKVLATKAPPTPTSQSEPTAPKPEPAVKTYSYTGSVPKGIDSVVLSYLPIITKYAPQFNLDPALIAAVIQQESSGNPRCLSGSGAAGLMQLMPENCVEYRVSDPYDPEQNIRGGMHQLADYIKRFRGSIQNGLIAYNAGPRRVIDGTWPNRKESREYVPKVFRYYAIFRTVLPSSGFTDPLGDEAGGTPVAGAKFLPVISGHEQRDATLDELNELRSKDGRPSLAQNGRLTDIAEGMAILFASGSSPFTDTDALEWVAQTDLSLKAASVLCLKADRFEDLGSILPVKLSSSPIVGIAHTTNQGKHYWVIVFGQP